MSLVSRFIHGYQAVIKRIPIASFSRYWSDDFQGKGKAEENVFFKKEERLLEKIRQALGIKGSDDGKNPKNADDNKNNNNKK